MDDTIPIHKMDVRQLASLFRKEAKICMGRDDKAVPVEPEDSRLLSIVEAMSALIRDKNPQAASLFAPVLAAIAGLDPKDKGNELAVATVAYPALKLHS